MKVAILAGGLGTRLAEETELKPKPMVEVGGRPILWHILKHYAYYGWNHFVIALGYKGDTIKRYFLDYHSSHSKLTVTTLKAPPAEKSGGMVRMASVSPLSTSVQFIGQR